MITVGVIGCGRIGQRHIQAYKALENVAIIPCDTDITLLQSTCRANNLRGPQTYESLLELPDLDAVDICVPTKQHHQIILDALDHGKDIFCEKPLTYSLDLAQQIKRKQEETGRTVMVGYLYRFAPSFQTLKQILDQRVIGEPYFAIFRVGGRGDQRPWNHMKSEAGGATLHMLVHILDLTLWYFGKPTSVELLKSKTFHKSRMIDGQLIEADVEDYVLLNLSMDGLEVICEADMVTPGYMNIVEVQGTNGSFFGSVLDYLPTLVYCKEASGSYAKGLNVFKNPYTNLFEKELQHFIDVLNNNADPTNSVDDSIKILKIIDALKPK